MGVAYNSRVVVEGLVLALDAANTKSYPTKNFVSSKIYSSFGASLRSSNYTVQYSDDNSNWTTAFTGVASNNTSCGIQQNTGSGSGSYGLHRYWRYVEGSPVQSHHPRVSRIILTDINGIDYNLVVYTSDNCSDTGTYQVGTVSLDFGGTTWTDMSTNGNSGTLVNGVGYSASNGGALSFDGVDDYIQFSTVSVQTVCFWGRMDPTIPELAALVATSAGGDGSLRTYPAGTFRTSPDDNDFHTGFVSSLMINGVSNLSSDGVGGLTIPGGRTLFQDFYVGAIGNARNISTISHTFSGRVYKGRVYAVYLYNRQLTNAELLQNYNALKSRYI